MLAQDINHEAFNHLTPCGLRFLVCRASVPFRSASSAAFCNSTNTFKQGELPLEQLACLRHAEASAITFLAEFCPLRIQQLGRSELMTTDHPPAAAH